MILAGGADWPIWQAFFGPAVLALYVAACLLSPAVFDTRLFADSLFF